MTAPIDTHAVDAAVRLSQQRWRAPSPLFASGFDPRTSDNALLTLFYGGLVNAATHQWLNAGRRLIDKTYVDMLWHIEGLTAMRSRGAEQIAADLDNFVRDVIAPHWASIDELTSDTRQRLAIDWVCQAAAGLFGPAYSEAAASRLLFWLCPQLPILPFSNGHSIALSYCGGQTPQRDYAGYQTAALALFADPVWPRPPEPPAATYGSQSEQQQVDCVLRDSDWWARHVGCLLLGEKGTRDLQIHASEFGCTDDGGLR